MVFPWIYLFSIGKVRQEMPEFKAKITIYLLHLFISCSLFLRQRKVDTSINKIDCSLFFSRGNSFHVLTIYLSQWFVWCNFELFMIIEFLMILKTFSWRRAFLFVPKLMDAMKAYKISLTLPLTETRWHIEHCTTSALPTKIRIIAKIFWCLKLN